MGKVYEEQTNTETGEAPEPGAFASAVLDAASINGWRVGAFKDRDLDVDDYCTHDYGDWKPQYEGEVERA
jgi:hypothetical protein